MRLVCSFDYGKATVEKSKEPVSPHMDLLHGAVETAITSTRGPSVAIGNVWVIIVHLYVVRYGAYLYG